jgi:hypothetical protein
MGVALGSILRIYFNDHNLPKKESSLEFLQSKIVKETHYE